LELVFVTKSFILPQYFSITIAFNMPRINRVARAANHSNPLVGCIMLLQEKIKFLSRSIVGCHCSEYETELSSLHLELASLQKKYKSLNFRFSKLSTFTKTSLAQYKARIKTLLLNNSSRLTLNVCQDKAYRAEIIFLRTQVEQLKDVLSEYKIPLPSAPTLAPWQVDVETHPTFWNANPEWRKRHPGYFPSDNPNDVQDRYAKLSLTPKGSPGFTITGSSSSTTFLG
jgi:hypothetical protein